MGTSEFVLEYPIQQWCCRPLKHWQCCPLLILLPFVSQGNTCLVNVPDRTGVSDVVLFHIFFPNLKSNFTQFLHPFFLIARCSLGDGPYIPKVCLIVRKYFSFEGSIVQRFDTPKVFVFQRFDGRRFKSPKIFIF